MLYLSCFVATFIFYAYLFYLTFIYPVQTDQEKNSCFQLARQIKGATGDAD